MKGRAAVAYLRRHGAFLSFALVAMAAPLFVSDAYYLSILALMAMRLIAVLGLSLLMGQAGQVSLGHGAFVGIGAYGSAVLTTRYGLDPWLALVASAILAALIAALIGMPTLKLKGHYLAMATLGFAEIIYILLVQLKSLTNGTDGITGIPSLQLGAIDFAEPRAYHLLVWGIALLILRFTLNLSDSRVGRSFRALHKSEVAALSLGINTSFRKIQAFVVSAIFGSFAGSLYVHYVHYISPDSYGITYSIILVTTVVIGGLGGIWGAVWGSIFMILLPEYLRGFDQDYTELAFGVLLILVMIFLPGGMIGLRSIGGSIRRKIRPKTTLHDGAHRAASASDDPHATVGEA